MRDKDFCLVVVSDRETRNLDNYNVFLTETILDYNDLEFFDRCDYDFLKGPWNSIEYKNNHKEFVSNRVARYRKEVSSIISKNYNVDLNIQGWRLILDAWLYHLLSIIFDRINYIEYAKNEKDNLYIYSFKKNLSPPINSNDFLEKIQGDDFNQYLYCEAASIVGIEVRSKTYQNIKNKKKYTKNNSWLIVKLNTGVRFFLNYWVKLLNPVIIIDGYFPFIKSIKIMIFSMGRVLFIPSRYFFKPLKINTIDEDNRGKIKVSEIDRYDKMANIILNKLIPISLFEGIQEYIKIIGNGAKPPGIIGSSIGFYSDDLYKIYAAVMSKKGSKIIGFQHGGNYRVYDWYIHNLEIESADRYYFWNSIGLAGDRLPTTKLNNLKRTGPASLSCNSILFISTVFLRYPFFRYSPNLIGQGIEMLNLQFQFYKKLSVDLRRNLVLRQNTSGHGDSFRYKKRWVDFSEEKICFDNFKTCEEAIKNSKIVLVDHISTTWIETIFINKPIIIYFDYSHDYIEGRVQILFRLLESVSILHKTPESAAIFLNNNYENIDAWWGSDRVSSAISEIKEYFYNDCDGFVEKWTNELLDVESQCNNNK